MPRSIEELSFEGKTVCSATAQVIDSNRLAGTPVY